MSLGADEVSGRPHRHPALHHMGHRSDLTESVGCTADRSQLGLLAAARHAGSPNRCRLIGIVDERRAVCDDVVQIVHQTRRARGPAGLTGRAFSATWRHASAPPRRLLPMSRVLKRRPPSVSVATRCPIRASANPGVEHGTGILKRRSSPTLPSPRQIAPVGWLLVGSRRVTRERRGHAAWMRQPQEPTGPRAPGPDRPNRPCIPTDERVRASRQLDTASRWRRAAGDHAGVSVAA